MIATYQLTTATAETVVLLFAVLFLTTAIITTNRILSSSLAMFATDNAILRKSLRKLLIEPLLT